MPPWPLTLGVLPPTGADHRERGGAAGVSADADEDAAAHRDHQWRRGRPHR